MPKVAMKRTAFVLLMVVVTARLETATVQGWARSYSYDDRLTSRSAMERNGEAFIRQMSVRSLNGGASCAVETLGPMPPNPLPTLGSWSNHYKKLRTTDYPRTTALTTTFVDTGQIQVGLFRDGFHNGLWITLPYWVIAILVIVPPMSAAAMVAWQPFRRWNRLRQGLSATISEPRANAAPSAERSPRQAPRGELGALPSGGINAWELWC